MHKPVFVLQGQYRSSFLGHLNNPHLFFEKKNLFGQVITVSLMNVLNVRGHSTKDNLSWMINYLSKFEFKMDDEGRTKE